MNMTVLLAATHYLALGVGLGAVFARGLALGRLSRKPTDTQARDQVLFADSFWGLAALLWLSTGLLRAFGGFEKGTQYYLHNHWFMAKMGLFGLVFLLELPIMVHLTQWRVRLGKKTALQLDPVRLKTFAAMNALEIVLTLAIPFFASLMARGV